MVEQDAVDVVATYAAGSVDADVLQDHLPEAWARALDDKQTRAELAELFGTAPEALDPKVTPPFRFRPERAGIDIGSVAITVLVWVGSDVFLGTLIDVARDEVKRRLKQAWTLLEPNLRDVFDVREALGPKKADDENPPGKLDD